MELLEILQFFLQCVVTVLDIVSITSHDKVCLTQLRLGICYSLATRRQELDMTFLMLKQ